MNRIGRTEGREPLDIGKVGGEILGLEMTRERENDVDLRSAKTYASLSQT